MQMVQENSELDALRGTFLQAQRDFKEKLQSRPVPESSENVLAPLARALLSVFGSKAISWEVAAKGYAACHEALSKLADDATEPAELRKYSDCMLAATAEYTAVVDKILANNSGSYEKLTDALKTAASDLKNALQRAKDTAKALNLLAGVVGAFSKLIPIL